MAVKPGGAWWILGMGAISTYGEEPKYPDAGPVIDLMLTPSGTSVTMSWIPPTPLPGVVPPVGYVVKLEETGETVDVTDTNYIWDGLQIDTSYCFSVYSKSELGTLSAPVKDCVITLKEVGADDAAQITHIATSTFAISNTTRGIFEYYLSRSDTDFSQASLISDPASFTVTRNGDNDLTPYYVLTTYPGVTETSLMQKTSFVCTSVTYSSVSVPPTCTDRCGVAYQCPGHGPEYHGYPPGTPCRPCWGYANDGNYCCGGVCCGGSRGQDCKDNPDKQVKNDPPSGYTERYSEWVKINNLTNTKNIKEKDTGIFAITGVEWDDKYYMEIPMPPPHPAQVIDEDTGEPTGELLENVPAWDYTDIYFIHYDINGEVVWAMDNINNRECFTVVEKEPMKKYNMWVSNLPIAHKGTYEFVISNPDEEFVRVEGDV